MRTTKGSKTNKQTKNRNTRISKTNQKTKHWRNSVGRTPAVFQNSNKKRLAQVSANAYNKINKQQTTRRNHTYFQNKQKTTERRRESVDRVSRARASNRFGWPLPRVVAFGSHVQTDIASSITTGGLGGLVSLESARKLWQGVGVRQPVVLTWSDVLL